MTRRREENEMTDVVARAAAPQEIAPGLHRVRTLFANAYLVADDGSWTLVDAGLPGYGVRLQRAAAAVFGVDARPAAIVLTHGHFDHAGSALELAREWDVPVYAHRLELPYLRGDSAYPPKDPTVGGALAMLSRLMPDRTIDLGDRVTELPVDGSVPGLPSWRLVDTPGHTPGHVAFWRAEDRTLLSGDALVTVDLDSVVALATSHPACSCPPKPFTSDWQAAGDSIRKIAELGPTTLAAGHGEPMRGDHVPGAVLRFANHFEPPAHGRYAHAAAVTDEQGIVLLPPRPADPVPKIAAGVAIGAVAAVAFGLWRRSRRTEDDG